MKFGPKDKSKIKKFKLISLKDFILRDGHKDNKSLDIFDKAIKVVKCDMSYINMVNNNPIMLNNDNIELISNMYWTGKKNNLTFEVDRINGKKEIIKKESVYEYLIEGIFEEVE